MPLSDEQLAAMNGWPGVHGRPTRVRVEIGEGFYDGARYRTPEGETRFYLLGTVPWSHETHQYHVANDGHYWYVAGWTDARTVRDKRYAEFHPFGEWFGLHASSVPLTRDDGVVRPIWTIKVRERS